ncbi:MAG: exopolysaccharide biosynthesis polyprenyl glycosylphosphotransferase [Acidimicrobiales bacterium]
MERESAGPGASASRCPDAGGEVSVEDDLRLDALSPRVIGLRRVIPFAARLGVARWLAIGDLAAIVGALTVADAPVWATLVAAAVLLTALDGLLLYRSRLTVSVLDEFPRLTLGVALAGAVPAGLAAVLADQPLGRSWWLGVGGALAAATLARMLIFAVIRAARRRRIVAHRTLIVGTDDMARHLAALMSNRPASGLQAVAFFDPTNPAETLYGLPIHHNLSLENAAYAAGANVIVIAFGTEPDYEAVQRVRDAAHLPAEIFFVPRFHELQGVGSNDMDHLYDVPLFRLRRWSHRTTAWRGKRAFDVAVAAVALVVLAPLLAATALAVAITMGRPVLFRQERIGIGNEPFTILKFRSLPNAPADMTDADWNSQTTRRPNVVGRFIRAASIDELPQLWNVLRGDMSLVGPRPERPGFVADFSARYPDYRQRHRVPAGITGLAQVEGLRGDTPIADRARFDNLYVENWSLWNDVKILCRTVGSVFRREGN